MVLGESEILGQLHAAQGHSEHAGTAGEQLQGIFVRAIRVGRRARGETGICRNAASVSSEAVRLAADSMGALSGCRVLVVGTGRMARLAGESLRRRGVTDLTVASRTCEHAGALATVWGARTIAWDALLPALSEVDLVVSATGAPQAVLSTEVVAAALAARASHRPLLFLDIALPRDVEPGVRQLPGVEVFDLEDLQSRLRDNLDARSRDVPSVERIIAEEVGRFRSWRRGCALRPVLGAMHRRGEEIRRREVERMLRRIPDATPELREQVEALTLALVRKLLHEPSRRLRDETDPLRSSAYVAATRDLFALRESEHPSAAAGEQ
jgi:glutamyl-tRNA reductase